MRTALEQAGVFDPAAALRKLQAARQRAIACVGGIVPQIAIDHRLCRLVADDYTVLLLTNAEGTRWNVVDATGPLEAFDDPEPAVAYAVSAAVTDRIYEAVCV